MYEAIVDKYTCVLQEEEDKREVMRYSYNWDRHRSEVNVLSIALVVELEARGA